MIVRREFDAERPPEAEPRRSAARPLRRCAGALWIAAVGIAAVGIAALSATAVGAEEPAKWSPETLASPEQLGGSLRLMLLLGVLSMAPAILLMTTSFVRIIVVLGLLRQALGNTQAPPNQVVTAAAMFLSLLIMTPVWQDVYRRAVAPYQAQEITLQEAWTAGVTPVRQFMSRQIHKAENSEDIWLFFRHLPAEQQSHPPQFYDDVPLQVLLPAFLLSELKTAFLIGFRIFLPFLVLDFVVAAVTTSMGLTMLPPQTVSFPFKLLLFVLVDGWRLVVGMLLDSFAPMETLQ